MRVGMPPLISIKMAKPPEFCLRRQIWNLTRLTTQDLRESHFNTLPSTIGNLTNLHTLDLRIGRIHSLPPEMDKITALERIHLEGNFVFNGERRDNECDQMAEILKRNSLAQPQNVAANDRRAKDQAKLIKDTEEARQAIIAVQQQEGTNIMETIRTVFSQKSLSTFGIEWSL
jgi:hypothetical protein